MRALSRLLAYLTWAAIAAVVAFIPVPGLAHDRVTAGSQALAQFAGDIQASHIGRYGDLNPPSIIGQTPRGPVVAYTGPFADAPSQALFGLNVNGVPQADCLPLLERVSPRFVDVWVAAAGPHDVGASVFSQGRLDHRKASQVCHAHAWLGFDFIGR